MTESQVVNEWISQGQLKDCREKVIRLLQRRFPGQVTEDIIRCINAQESLPLLDDWFDAALTVASIPDFLVILRR
jgi:hypothetical protein